MRKDGKTMDRVLRCPICNKQPKFKFEFVPTGVFVKIRCKPLFRKTHLEVERGTAGTFGERATANAIKDWNNKVVKYMCNITERSDAE